MPRKGWADCKAAEIMLHRACCYLSSNRLFFQWLKRTKGTEMIVDWFWGGCTMRLSYYKELDKKKVPRHTPSCMRLRGSNVLWWTE